MYNAAFVPGARLAGGQRGADAAAAGKAAHVVERHARPKQQHALVPQRAYRLPHAHVLLQERPVTISTFSIGLDPQIRRI